MHLPQVLCLHAEFGLRQFQMFLREDSSDVKNLKVSHTTGPRGSVPGLQGRYSAHTARPTAILRPQSRPGPVQVPAAPQAEFLVAAPLAVDSAAPLHSRKAGGRTRECLAQGSWGPGHDLRHCTYLAGQFLPLFLQLPIVLLLRTGFRLSRPLLQPSHPGRRLLLLPAPGPAGAAPPPPAAHEPAPHAPVPPRMPPLG